MQDESRPRSRKPYLVVLGIFVLGIGTLVSGLLEQPPLGLRLNEPMAIAAWVLHSGLATLVLWTWRRPRRRLPRIGLALASMLVVLLVLEIALRQFHPIGAGHTFHLWHSTEMHHTLPKGNRFYFEAGPFSPSALGEEPKWAETNDLGLRSAYTRETFNAGSPRILVLGDSFVFGLYVGQDEHFPQLLEQNLRSMEGLEGATVLNAGTVSYSPTLSARLMERYLDDWQPDLVFYVVDATDIADDERYAQQLERYDDRFRPGGYLRLLPDGPRLSDHLALRQRFYAPTTFLYFLLFEPWVVTTTPLVPFAAEIEIDGEIVSNVFFHFEYPPEQTRPFFDQTLAQLDRLDELSRARGAEFVTLLAPRYNIWAPEAAPNSWERPFYPKDPAHESAYLDYLKSRSGSLGFPILDLLPAFAEAPDPIRLVFDDDPHWTPLGHQRVADAVTQIVLDHLPGRAGEANGAAVEGGDGVSEDGDEGEELSPSSSSGAGDEPHGTAGDPGAR